MNTESNDTSLVEKFSIEGSESTSQVSLKDIKNDKDHISSVIGYVKQSNTSIISLFNGYPRWCSLDTSNDTLSDAIANIGESCRRWCFLRINMVSTVPESFYQKYLLYLSLPLVPRPPPYSFSTFLPDPRKSDIIRIGNISLQRTAPHKNPLGINDIHPPFSRSWKTYVKKGIGLNYQRMFFVKYTGIESFIREHPDYYLSSVLHSFGGCCPPNTILSFPFTYNGIFHIKEHPLLEERALSSIGFILSILSIHNPNISFCPILPNILGIVASCCTLDETLCFGQALLTHSSQANNLLPLHPVDYVLIQDSLIDTLKSYFPNKSQIINALSANTFLKYYTNFMVGYVPYGALFCILDQFLVSGIKTITRYILAAAKVAEDILNCAETTDEFISVLNYVLLAYPDPSILMKNALKIDLTTIPLNQPSQDRHSFTPLKMNMNTSVIEYSTLELIWQHIPVHRRVLEPNIVFNSSIDGVSFYHMYNKVRKYQPLLFVLKTEQGIVGMFLSHTLLLGSAPYFGNGEDFLFKIDLNKILHTYHWTEKNSLFCSTKNENLFFGGGGEGPALLVKKNFTVSSYSSETFGNPRLFDKVNLPIVCLEIFTMG
ncbi:hypothetical protein ENUP19_0273G0004 [Entamoeba nuttalli]|uniref:TLD domain containing protein n=2 Tax=Entamoeba nuttalli TaxID=412467 RepID=K2HX10_ENTNP|nr:TLD domain containing protein [Entamoeba nuttalli P19]EKE40855.1 TLD domain containing protein [Entamoeba nuttalli P19]|eukprot:XP_008856808.1 TLD domain containing protein [Entamoeba nuttalli P19]